MNTKKYSPEVFTILSIVSMFCFFACKKSGSEMSQRDRELAEPLLENQIIMDGAVRMKLDYQNAQIELSGTYLQITQAGVNYFIENMPDNTETVIYVDFKTGSGTFDLMAEGFTASTFTKRFFIKGNVIGSGKKEFMKVQKGIVKYTFIKLL